MKKRVLSMFMALALCLTLLPAPAFAEGEDVSISGGVIGGGETGGEGGGVLVPPGGSTGEGGGIYVAPGGPTEGGGGTYIPGEDTRTEIWCVSKPDSIGRSYDGTTDGGTIPIDLTFTDDGTNEIKLKEGTGFTAKKTFDSADAGSRTVTVEIELIGDAAAKYKLKAGEEKFKIGGNINKAYPDLTVSLSKAACTVGEKILPLLSVSGVQENAAVTYYYTPHESIAGYSDYESSGDIPAIDENTAISSFDEEDNNTYYVYAKTAATTNYTAGMSNIVELTVTEPAAASVTKADGTDGGTYKSLPAALDAARDGDTVKLLANHTTNWSDVEAGEYATLAVVTKTLTLDLNGMTVDYLTVGDVVPDEEGGILDSYDGNLTVVDNIQGDSCGKIKNLEFVKGSLAIQGGWIGDYDGSKLTCNGNSGSVIISGGTVYNATVGDGATVTVTGGTGHAGNWCNDGTLNITDGTFGEVKFYNNSGTIAISGGTFSTLQNFDNTSSLIAPISLLAPGHAFYKDNTVQDGSRRDFLQDVTVKEHTHTMVNNKCACGLSCTHTNAEGASTIGKDGKCTVCGTQFAAGIGETYYTDVKSALDVASDGQTVKLLANEMLPDGIYVSKTLTLDLNGHSLDGYSLNVGGLTAMSQVCTGNLTVIDSSGGNGTVGVTVREGGTLVFDPKNDHTTLLQLEVWGGTVELYGGKISRSGLRLNNGITLGNLLPGQAGLAYYRGDTQLTLEEASSHTCDLVVKSCSHGGKNGFDENATACPYCNAPAVAETDLNGSEGVRLRRRFANLQTALDADRDGGATFQLLTDVTGDYTIDGTQDTGLNLNGHSIKGTVTVKTATGNNTTTFSNTQNTTTAGIDVVVAYKGAKLAGADYPAVISKLTLADTTKWKDILQQTTNIGFMVTNTDGTHTWYAPDDVKGSQLNNVIINYDKVAPDWSGNESGIRIKSTWWNKLLSSVPFGLYKGSSLDVYAKANDSQSGVAEYYYYIDNSGSTTTLTAEELANKSFTKVAADKNGTTKLTEITSDNNYVIYAYAVDAAGNRSIYISSDGVVLDNTAPKLTNVSAPVKSNETLSDTSATITFNGSEAGTYYYILKEDGEIAPTVMSDFATKTAGDKVDTWTAKEGVSTGTLTADEGNTIKFTGLKANTSYILYLAATDAVGNASVAESAGADGGSGVVFVSFTTTKTIPYVKTAPVLSGNYGDTVSAMLEKADITKASVTAGPSSDTKIEGTWTLASEDADKLPTVGTSEKYTLVFTPAGSDADTYDSVTCEVTPEVSKKQISVVISDKEKFYGEANPALTWSLATGEAYADNVLVAGDTEEALGISLSTTAKDNSNVGTYAITGLSDSANYEVSFSGSGSDGKSGVMTVKQAANSFTTTLSCSGYTYAKDETPKPNATAKFGTVTYKYAKADSDGNAPAADSAYTDDIPVNAGTYAVKAYVAETDNYAGLTSDPAVFTIGKAAEPTIAGEEKSYAYSAGSDGKTIGVDIAGKLPTDRGTTIYTVAKTDTEQLLSEVTVDTAGNLTYKVNQVDSTKVGKTAIIIVTASMENYANAGYTLTISITDKKTVEIKGGNSVSVDGSNVLIYGEKISKLTLGNTVFVEAGTDDVIEGILSWSNPDEIPAAGTTQAGWVFKPADSTHYAELTGTAAITVAKATPVIAENPTATALTYGQKLSDSTLTGGKATYKTADGTEVAGTFAWKNGTTKPAAVDSGKTEYDVTFTPSDTDNYNAVDMKISLTVNKAAKAPNMPEAAMAPAHNTKKVGDIILPEGWSWQEADKDTALADGVAVTATAVYTGSDKGNYETESIIITITRSTCDHLNTELRDQKAATCTGDGYSGDKYCKDCGVLVERGTSIAKTGHSYGEPQYTWGTDADGNVTCTAVKTCINGCLDTIEGHTVSETVTATSTVTAQPTCNTKGTTSYTAEFTGNGFIAQSKTEDNIPTIPHTLTEVQAKAATAAEAGNKAYYVCGNEGCGKYFADSKGQVEITDKSSVIIPAAGSSSGGSLADTKPTVPSRGTEVKDKSGTTYKVTGTDRKKQTVQYTKPKKNAKGTVTVPSTVKVDGVTYKVTSIAANAFKNNKKISKVVVGNNIVSIEKNAFANCKKLTSVTLGKNVKTISKDTFSGCDKLKVIIIKSTKLTSASVAKDAFEDIPDRATIKVPKSKYKKYKKLLRKKGLSKKVKIVKR